MRSKLLTQVDIGLLSRMRKDSLLDRYLINIIRNKKTFQFINPSITYKIMLNNQEPENIDKEFLRRWYVSVCDPYNDEVLPDAPPELISELSRR